MEKFQHQKTESGVRFFVQQVEVDQPLKTCDKDREWMDYVKKFYDEEVLQPIIEATSLRPENLVAKSGSFVNAAILAFDGHYPLSIYPDDIWSLMSFALATHVDQNSETLRSKFVEHEGKKVLKVRVDHFIMGSMKTEDWERDVFPIFSAQIREHIGESTHLLLADSFSTTTPSMKAAHEITLMAAMKHYFSYTMRTCCGIPWIQLHGTEADWVNLRERAKKIGNLMTPAFSDQWLPHLLPILDEFLNAYRGSVNQAFWQGMVKRVNHGVGSGSYSTISGWINLFYPYLESKKENKFIMPWQNLIQSDGPEPEDFPAIISSAPVEWDYHGRKVPLHFHAGHMGIIQSPETLALSTRIGWIISHDPPSSPEDRISILLEEIERLETHLQSPEGQKDYASDWRLKQSKAEVKKLQERK